jgi:hypothetical protein
MTLVILAIPAYSLTNGEAHFGALQSESDRLIAFALVRINNFCRVEPLQPFGGECARLDHEIPFNAAILEKERVSHLAFRNLVSRVQLMVITRLASRMSKNYSVELTV